MSSKNIFGLLANLDVNDGDYIPPAPEEESKTLEGETHPPKDETQNLPDNTPHPEDEPQSPEDEVEDEIIHATFDLAAFEANRPGPVFTRTLLHQISSHVSLITAEQAKHPSQRTLQSLEYTGADGTTVVVWKSVFNGNSGWVQYMTRIELAPSFSLEYGNVWYQHIDRQRLNPPVSAITPYYITSYKRSPSPPLNPTLLSRLLRTQELWLASKSCGQLSHIITLALGRLNAPITQIVGIGLGKFSEDAAWYAGSALQHISIIHFCCTITTYNSTRFPTAQSVKIVLSDPCYTDADAEILEQLAGNIDVQMGLSDPDVLLKIDRGTMVLSAYLPWKFPMMQILADLFSASYTSANSPAVLSIDKLHPPSLDPATRNYVMRNRSAPHVARWLMGYDMWQGKFVGAGDDVEKDIGGARYWVKDMGIWVRKNTPSARTDISTG
jgi:hypothetical protein